MLQFPVEEIHLPTLSGMDQMQEEIETQDNQRIEFNDQEATTFPSLWNVFQNQGYASL